MVTICLVCGDHGFSNAFVYCVKCLNCAVHRYCLDEFPRSFDEFVRSVCEDCEDKTTVTDSSSRRNKKLHESSFPSQFGEVSSEIIDSSPESMLGGDSSPRNVNVKKKKRNYTNLVTVTDSSSHHSLDSHASIDSNEQSQLTSNSPSSLTSPKDMISTGFYEQFPKRPCTSVGDSLKVIQGTGSSSYFAQEKESKIGEPVVDIIWRGSFSIWNTDYEIVDGIVAHLSVNACEKVYKEARVMPSLLHMEMLPKSDVWPNSFKTSGPTHDNIALYFFPANTRCERGFDDLVNLMIHDELAMRVLLPNAELLVFTSNQLPLHYWRFKGKYFIWGVFRGKLNPNLRAEIAPPWLDDDERREAITKGMNK